MFSREVGILKDFFEHSGPPHLNLQNYSELQQLPSHLEED